jgi:zinc D-Ala-D-Ala carboxypeptidase
MRKPPRQLVNTPEIEIWPGGLLRARGNRDARALARAIHVLRRKHDGRYLAAELPEGLLPLIPRLQHEPGLDAALDALQHEVVHVRPGLERVPTLPVHGLRERLDGLGLDADDYAAQTGLALVPEPERLAFAGFDRYRRALWLHPDTARDWHRLHAAALRDDVVLDAISGYRSHDYQLGIFARKRARGEGVEDILRVNAAPGFSEHHSGRALDLSTHDEPAAEESFEATPAFAWLSANAATHGFAMTYPRNNPHGIVYEPWHWCHAAAS